MAASQVIAESASRISRTRARNRDALIRAARTLFTQQGFEATAIAAIAESADLGFGTFYRHFPDKEAILEAVLDLARVEIDAVLTHAENESAAPAEALCALTTRFARTVRRNHDVLSLFWKVGVRSDDGRGPKRVGIETLPRERLLPVMLGGTIQKIIERGMAAAEFAPVDAVLVSRYIASAHMYLLGPWVAEHSEEELVDVLCDLELSALGDDSARQTKSARKRKGNGRIGKHAGS
jgi:AcrR family transcriptional regulator